jgi:membrane-bound lytic murein transglycosylase B
LAGALALVAGAGTARATPGAAGEAEAEIAAFIERLWLEARARRVVRGVFDRAMAGFVPDPEVLELATRQPEFVKPTSAYIGDLVTPARIDQGRQLAAQHAILLQAIEDAYGADRHVLLAIWGVESAYGTAKGARNVIRSLATLALRDARRAGFWRGELIAALRIVQEGAAAPATMAGSWAGAMGHTQFIPSTFNAHAVDFDKDGRRDVWESPADALASTANYLRASGWRKGLPWGFETILPPGFDYAWSAPGRARSLVDWLAAGVRIPAARGTMSLSEPLQLVLPAGAHGPAFLVTGNFRALLRYNNAVAYALAVGHLADRIAGGTSLTSRWPADEKPLASSEREELQRLLASRGLETGGVDGILGDQTRAAIRAAQRAFDMAQDGHPTAELLHRLRAGVAR